MDVAPETKRILCNNCRELTNHLLRAGHSRELEVVHDDTGEAWAIGGEQLGPRPEEFSGSDYSDRHKIPERQIRTSIWSCAGCDLETFEWQYLLFDENGECEVLNRFYYPERRCGSVEPKRFQNLSSKLNQIYSEIVACFNRGALLLCTIGLRALLEGICRDKGLSEGNLEKKIDGLIKFLPSVNLIEALHSLRFAGNAGAHELDSLNGDDAAKAIEIIEDLLNFLYELDYKASQVRITASKGQPKSGLIQ